MPQISRAAAVLLTGAPFRLRGWFRWRWGAVMGEEVEPSRLYEIKAELDESGICLDQEVQRFCEIFFAPKQRQSTTDHKFMNAALDPAVDRFEALRSENDEAAEVWRGKLQAFRNLYAFLEPGHSVSGQRPGAALHLLAASRLEAAKTRHGTGLSFR